VSTEGAPAFDPPPWLVQLVAGAHGPASDLDRACGRCLALAAAADDAASVVRLALRWVHLLQAGNPRDVGPQRRAVAVVDQAMRLTPEAHWPRLLFARGLAQEALWDLAGAQASLGAAIALDPDSGDAQASRLELANVAFLQGRAGDAVAEYARVAGSPAATDATRALALFNMVSLSSSSAEGQEQALHDMDRLVTLQAGVDTPASRRLHTRHLDVQVARGWGTQCLLRECGTCSAGVHVSFQIPHACRCYARGAVSAMQLLCSRWAVLPVHACPHPLPIVWLR
jgi:hypothetical protein